MNPPTQDPNDANAFVRKKLREHPKYADSTELEDQLREAILESAEIGDWMDRAYLVAHPDNLNRMVEIVMGIITQKETKAVVEAISRIRQSVMSHTVPEGKDLMTKSYLYNTLDFELKTQQEKK